MEKDEQSSESDSSSVSIEESSVLKSGKVDCDIVAVENEDSANGTPAIDVVVIEEVKCSENTEKEEETSESRTLDETHEKTIETQNDLNKETNDDTDTSTTKEIVAEVQENTDTDSHHTGLHNDSAAPIVEKDDTEPPVNSAQKISEQNNKQEQINETIKQIISDIDSTIEKSEQCAPPVEEPKIKEEPAQIVSEVVQESPQLEEKQIVDVPASHDKQLEAAKAEELKLEQLRQQEADLLKKHEELLLKIQEQQALAAELSADNVRKQQILNEQNLLQSRKDNIPEPPSHNITNDKGIPLGKENYETPTYFSNAETSHEVSEKRSTHVDLNKIFTPAQDNAEILPKNRKLFASSAFYSPQYHPTVEDQLELARKISNSLSDTTNETSKGQSMYVNRKKRSVKWIHEGSPEEFQQASTQHIDATDKLQPVENLNKFPLRSDVAWQQNHEQTHPSPILNQGLPKYDFHKAPQGDTTLHASKSPILEYRQPSEPVSNNRQSCDTQRDLAYMPSIPKGWNSPSVELPKELYVPKEIPLESYAPPPTISPRLEKPDRYNYLPSEATQPNNNYSGLQLPQTNRQEPRFQSQPFQSQLSPQPYQSHPSPQPFQRQPSPQPFPSRPSQSQPFYAPPPASRSLHAKLPWMNNEEKPQFNKSQNIPPYSQFSAASNSPSSNFNSQQSAPLRFPSGENFMNRRKPEITKICNGPNFNKAARGWNQQSTNSNVNKFQYVSAGPTQQGLPFTDF